MEKTHVNVQRIHRAKKSGEEDWFDANQESGPVLSVGVATVLDVPGIEVQVPSLSTPERSMWILISRGHERFVNEILRHNPEIVNHSSSLRTKEEDFINVSLESVKPVTRNREHGPEGSNISKSNDKISSELRKAVVSTTSATSSKSGNPIVLKPSTYSIDTKKEILFLDAKIAEDIPLKLASPSVSQTWCDTMMSVNER